MGKMITAYVYDKLFSGMPAADAEKLTHVNYSFALIKDGKADASHWRSEDKLKLMMDSAPWLTVCLSIGGWSADGFSQSAATAEGREKLADSIAALLKKYGFKGIDIDWEYPNDSIGGIASSPDDVENFPAFVNLLRQKLDLLGAETGVKYLLTMAVGAGGKCVSNFAFSKMADSVDFVNVMTYDMAPWDADKPTWHHAALYLGAGGKGGDCGDNSIMAYNRIGVPMEKLVLGAAFYGRKYTGVERGGDNGLHSPHSPDFPAGINYTEICERIGRSAERHWDDFAKAPYIYDESAKMFATYDDAESIAHKAEYVKKNGLGGIMFWEYCYPGTTELLNAVYSSMNENP